MMDDAQTQKLCAVVTFEKKNVHAPSSFRRANPVGLSFYSPDRGFHGGSRG